MRAAKRKVYRAKPEPELPFLIMDEAPTLYPSPRMQEALNMGGGTRRPNARPLVVVQTVKKSNDGKMEFVQTVKTLASCA